MVQFRPRSREIIAKVVYYGPPLGGKTTNLRTLYAGYPAGTRGELVVVPAGGDRTIFFDFLPVDAGTLRGMRMRVQLYTVPGQVHYNATRQVVLRGVDAVVFVADSQHELMRSNRESWENLKDNLALQGLSLTELPHVLQYNKRDLPDVLSVEDMDELLNEFNAPFYEAVATTGVGVEETLQGVVKLVARSLRDRFKMPAEAASAEIVEPWPTGSVAVPPPRAPLRSAPQAPPGATPPESAKPRPPDLVTPPTRVSLPPVATPPPRAREAPPAFVAPPPPPTVEPIPLEFEEAASPATPSEPASPEPVASGGAGVFGTEAPASITGETGRVMLPIAIGTLEEEMAAARAAEEALPAIEGPGEEQPTFEEVPLPPAGPLEEAARPPVRPGAAAAAAGSFEEIVLPAAKPRVEPSAPVVFEEAVFPPASTAPAPPPAAAFEQVVRPPARPRVEPPAPPVFEEAVFPAASAPPAPPPAAAFEQAVRPPVRPRVEPPPPAPFETVPPPFAEPFAEPGPLADPFGEVSAGGGASGDVFQLEPPLRVAVHPEVQFAAKAPLPLELSPDAKSALVQRVVPRALAQVGEVRELELEVPVPAVWTGGKRLTLQLRLTLVPEEDTHAE